MASQWCEAVLYSPDPPFLFGGGSGNETRSCGAVQSVVCRQSLTSKLLVAPLYVLFVQLFASRASSH